MSAIGCTHDYDGLTTAPGPDGVPVRSATCIHCGAIAREPSDLPARTLRVSFVMEGGFNDSGGDRVISSHAQYLHDRGHSVAVVSRPARRLSLIDRLRRVRHGESFFLPRMKSHFAGLSMPRHVLKERRPVSAQDLPDADIVIATWWETAEWVEALPAAKGLKAHFIQGYESFSEATRARVEAVWHLPMPKIVVSKWLRDRALGNGTDIALWVPNGVDATRFSAPPRGRQPIPTLGLLAHPNPLKGTLFTLDAIRRLLAQHPRIHLRTFGIVDFKPDLPEGLTHEHVTRPDQSEIAATYRGCDLWICGSTLEGFGLTNLEAMACGCPVVTTPSGGPEDLIDEGVNGFVLAERSVEAMAAALDRFLRLDDAGWTGFSQAATATAARFSEQASNAAFERALLTLAARPVEAGA